MSHSIHGDLAWNISLSFHFHDRLLHFGLWGFHAHLLTRTLYQVAIWQRDDSATIFQTAFSEHLPASFSFIKLHLFDLLLLRRATVALTVVWSRRFVTQQSGWTRQRMNMPQRYLHKLQQHLCQHMPPILKRNEQVIQMSCRVEWQQRDCRRLVCVSECSVPLTSFSCHLELFGGNAAKHIL